MTDKRERAVIEEVKKETIKLIDSSTVSLCLNLFDWAKFRTAKGGLKIHTVWDDALGLPDYINITDAKLHDSKGLISQVTRLKSNILYESIEELDLPVDRDQNIKMN